MDSIRTAYSDQSNITHSSATRKTIDGRRLTYTLNVLQQPEKARACGNGAKASADRRPVDPPPVVELRVFEGEDDNNLKDITTSYHNVNFFLFATLEQRPVANGRIQTPGPPSVAVLNGCNVAGINYLERPAPAGYFIFPDLSVRHEGHYRLTFGLYEQVKDPRDADPENPFPTQEPGQADRAGAPSKHNSSVQRLEVRSEEFQVYSAKKFPGLDRSTGLSIGLSDQGCRVRIRRDVRMRKRPKAKANDQPIGGDPLRGRYANQEMSLQDRQRSLSHCSRDGSQYGERRLSTHSNDPYSHAAAPSLGAPAPLGGANFAVPTMPNTPTSTLPPSATYHQGPVPTAYPSPVAAPPARAPEYAQPPSPYRPYEHRGSDASTVYNPSDSRRPSEAPSYHRPSDAAMYRLQEPASYRPQESTTYRPQEAYRPQEPAPYRQDPAPYRYSEHSRYQPADREPYRPTEPRHYATPAHYSYGPDDKRVTIIPEKPLLPSVHELIHASDMRSAEQMQPGKRAYSPPRWTSDSLKRGMRPSISHDEPEAPFPGILEYKRANGTTTQAPGGKAF